MLQRESGDEGGGDDMTAGATTRRDAANIRAQLWALTC